MKEHSPGKWTVFALVTTGSFMSTLDSSIVNVALPTLMGRLNTTMVTIEWVVLIYLIAFTSLILSFGRLSDIVGRRMVLVGGHGLFTLSSLLCALSPSVGALIAARALQGTGAAMIMSCSQALIVDAFPENERGKALGSIATVVAAGLTSGPAVGGFILTHFSWRMIFAVNIPVGLTVAVLAARILKGSEADTRRDEPFDLPGGLLIALSCGALFTGLTHAHAWGYTSFRVLGLTGTAIALALVFVAHENRTAHPVMDPSLFKERIFRLPVLSAITLYTALFTMVFLMPFYLLFPMGYSEAQVGTVMTIPFALLFVVPPFSGALADRMGSRILCVLGMGILSLALALLAWPTEVTAFPPIAFKLALAGFGVALFLPPNNTTIMSSVPAPRRGVASSVVGAARNLGMVTGVALAGAVFNHTYTALSGANGLSTYTQALQGPFLTAFRYALFCGAATAALGSLLAWLRGPDTPAR
ncbi:MFS transporter [Desulfoluna butyratoxydans]|uniref:Drug resistance transporter emrb/qaca subfamily n=1 Tax=Desulfoluna butyratoxydans TaxID=231438 RepID=A0A4U8YHZ2_9BACT|nr:MFS transporter [Desulfoluna butyratoxydans]VFQ43255.1 drug resistance transporter emrb/qaca subfamily [Desulfoluna butyratoxydans]